MNGQLILCRRPGAVLVEALLALPVLVLVTFAGVQYAQVVVFEQTVQAAADAAAREVAKLSITPIENRVEGAVNRCIGTFGLKVGEGVRIDLDGKPTNSSDIKSLPNPPAITLNKRDVAVTVQVQYAAARLPNALGYFGIDFSSRVFRATSVAAVH